MGAESETDITNPKPESLREKCQKIITVSNAYAVTINKPNTGLSVMPMVHKHWIGLCNPILFAAMREL